MPEGAEAGGVGLEVVQKARYAGLNTLRVLWAQRGSGNITARVLPFLKSPSGTVRTRAIVTLGRLEDTNALKSLEALRGKARPVDLMSSLELAGDTLYPELPWAIGRIKARKLSGEAKLNAVLSQINLNFGGLASLSRRINSDRYGWGYIGFEVINEAVRVLAQQKRGGQNVDAAISALTLRPEQKALLQAVSTSPAVEAERLLSYMARGIGGELLTEQVLDLRLTPKVVLDKVSAKLQARQKYPNPVGLVGVVEELAQQKNSRAKVMLQALAKDKSRGLTRELAQVALNHLDLAEAVTGLR